MAIMSLRVFAALPVPDAVADAVLDLMEGVPGARWRPLEALHITLAFYGEHDESVVEALDVALGRIRAAPFEITLAGAGRFGKPQPSSLWLGVAENPALHVLARQCAKAAREAGASVDARSYKPHLTLAYLGGDVDGVRVQRFEQRHGLYRCEPFLADRFHLYSSWTRKTGQPNAYRIEAEYPLQA